VKALGFGLRLNRGETCLAPKRVFVHRSIATELEERLAGAFGAADPVTEPINAAPNHFSIARESFTEALIPLIDDALARGAHFICHQARPQVIILGGVDPASRLLREDVFGPVLSTVTVGDDDEAVTRANDCPFALGASVFSADEAAALTIAQRLNAGVVSINDLIIPTADGRVPFGGGGRSGFGVTRGAEGLLDLARPKVVSVSRGKFRPAFEAIQESDAEMFSAWLRFDLPLRWRGVVVLLRAIRRRLKFTTPDFIL
jgi:acyl-CoA reductase-like NAD-dependent aldehyde dehydrogenase